ncbi:hypothetical protein N657DRAFT_339470 [Parathielavia appendiculata]|uniref:Uncharacterized protein n=1 Tax=Parathielavia appendiculata TaxID=2587402 RepID=A0AAN6U1V6_9PEZI|nr:hypothetical protein N657DRAFT_339470 [Parathielavia appendiculata]
MRKSPSLRKRYTCSLQPTYASTSISASKPISTRCVTEAQHQMHDPPPKNTMVYFTQTLLRALGRLTQPPLETEGVISQGLSIQISAGFVKCGTETDIERDAPGRVKRCEGKETREMEGAQSGLCVLIHIAKSVRVGSVVHSLQFAEAPEYAGLR